MAADILEVILEHDGREWQARGPGLVVRAASLRALDGKLANALAAAGTSGSVTVHMRYDNASLPDWTRQYMPHYFNRTVQFHPRSELSA